MDNFIRRKLTLTIPLIAKELLKLESKMARLVLALFMAVAVAFVVAQEAAPAEEAAAPAVEEAAPVTTVEDAPAEDDDDDDDSCEEAKDCPCGSICNDGTCTEGCMLFDTFMAAGSEAELYGRKCKCGTTPDERGMPLQCAENVEFTGAPAGVAEWENNPACDV